MQNKSIAICLGLFLSFITDAIFFEPFPELTLANIFITGTVILVLLDLKLITELVIVDWTPLQIFFLTFETIFYFELGVVFIWTKLAALIADLKSSKFVNILSKLGLPRTTSVYLLELLTAMFIFTCVFASSDTYKRLKHWLKPMYLKWKNSQSTSSPVTNISGSMRHQQYCYCPVISKLQMQLKEMDDICQPRTSSNRRKACTSNAKVY